MDYAGGTELWKHQWDLIHDPQTMLFAFGQDESEGESQLWPDLVCTQKFIEQFRWAYVNNKKLEYKADGYPWFGHFAKDMLLNGTTFKDITVKISQDLGFVPSKIDYKLVYDRAVFNFGSVLSITTHDKFSETSNYLFPSKENWERQIKGIVEKVKPDIELKQLLQTLAILPESEFDRFTPVQIETCMQNLSGKAFMMEDYATCINDEEIILNIVRSCEGRIDKQKELIAALKKPSAINRVLAHLDGKNLQEFVFKVAKYYGNVEKPDVYEMKKQYFNFNGQIYTKIFDWNETVGPNVIFESDNVVSSSEFKISTKYDYLSVFQDGGYLMKLGAFEYVSLSTEYALPYLPSDYVVGESVMLMPAFLFHYILGEKEFDQTLKDITTLADIGITVGTMGTYAAARTALVIAKKSAQGAIIDFSIQAFFLMLDDKEWNEAVAEVDYANVAWAAASIHITESKMTYILNCIRNGYRGAISAGNESLREALIAGGEDCLSDFIITYLSSKAIAKTDRYTEVILKKLTANPAFITKRLLKYGFSSSTIQNFKNGISKSSVKKIIDNTIIEYDKEAKQ